MKPNAKIPGIGVLILFCLWATRAHGQLLGVAPSYPQVNFTTADPNSVSYDPGSQIFSLNSVPLGIVFSESDPGSLINNGSVQMQFTTDGTIVSGTNGFLLTGQLTRVSGGMTNTYSGTLLQGDVTAFGSFASGFSAQFDFRVNITGGALASFFTCGNDLAVTLVCESSTFSGSFTNAFSGSALGICGPEDTVPPTVTCPPLSQVVTTPATNSGISGFIVTYPDPVVTDNCDPMPFIFEDTPSGTFVALNPGDTLTVNVYGIDVSGNVGSCSFTAAMGQSGSCPLAFTETSCGVTTLTNDPGECFATYAFSAPEATNCSGQTFAASATAVNQSGTMISLTNVGNGTYQGEFPRTTSGTNVITFTANDGNGNSATLQCFVAVVDDQPPTINCLNQTATFKPIETNALSCIEADFDNVCITSNNYIWFTSTIQTPSFKTNVFTVHIFDQTIQLQVDNTNLTLDVPDAYVIFSNGIPTATTTFSNGVWTTIAQPSSSERTFAAGLQWQVPFNLDNPTGKCWGRDGDDGSGFHRRVNEATWCGRFGVDKPGVVVQWQWSAVVHSKFTNDCNSLGVKPVDDNHESCWTNFDPAGTCENYKSFLICGARGQGWYGVGRNKVPDCTGTKSPTKRANLGVGILCEGPVDFTVPTAADNCDSSVAVTCTPPPGSVFGPGNYTIVATAVDSSGNSNSCSFTLTVLAPLQVIFDCPTNDNVNDNVCDADSGYTDFNCPDSPGTPQYVTTFNVGDKICHNVRLLDCNGNDVTSQCAQSCTVHIDVTEQQGSSYYDSIILQDLTENSNGSGTPGNVMVPYNGEFQYILDTAGYQSGTVNSSTFFRSCVWVEYNSSPGVPVGMEDVVLQSH